MTGHVTVTRLTRGILVADGLPVDARGLTAAHARTEVRRWQAIAALLNAEEAGPGPEPLYEDVPLPWYEQAEQPTFEQVTGAALPIRLMLEREARASVALDGETVAVDGLGVSPGPG